MVFEPMESLRLMSHSEEKSYKLNLFCGSF